MIVFTDGSSYEYFEPPSEQEIVDHADRSHFIQSADNKVSLNAGDNSGNDGDKAHLYLQGDLPVDEHFIRCTDDSGTSKFSVGPTGDVFANNIQSQTTDLLDAEVTELDERVVDHSDELDLIEGAIADIYDDVTSATHNAEIGTLVKRGDSVPTVFNDMSAHSLDVTGQASHLNLSGNAIMYWVPQNADGTNRDAIYRFGHNHGEVGSLDGAGGGLEFVEHQNRVFLQCSRTEPSMFIDCHKTDDNVEALSIAKHGTGVFGITQDGRILSGQINTMESDVVELQTNVAAIISNEEGVFGDSSVWIGSCKISFQRNSYELRIRYLKDDVIPKYLTDLTPSYTTADLPVGRTVATMNFIRWIQSARQFTGNTALSVTDIFPAANLDDDFNPVADFKNEQAVTNTASITAETTARTNADTALDTRVLFFCKSLKHCNGLCFLFRRRRWLDRATFG